MDGLYSCSPGFLLNHVWPAVGTKAARSKPFLVSDASRIRKGETVSRGLDEPHVHRALDNIVHAINAFVHQHPALGSGGTNTRHTDRFNEGRDALVRSIGSKP